MSQPVISAPPIPRPYQVAASAAVRSGWARGLRSQLLVLATGTGKTVIAADEIRHEVQLGHRVLFVAHREELLEQTQRKLADVGIAAGIEQASRRAGLQPVVIASVQTLRGARLAKFDPDEFGLVAVDEAHHAPAPSYRGVFDRFTGARVLGLTATPDRGDGLPLGDMFEAVAYRYEIREAIRDGFLAPLVARRIVLDGVDLSSVRAVRGDLDPQQLAAAMETEQAIHGVVVPVLELAGDRPTIVFGCDVQHAQMLATCLNRYRAGAARAVWGDMPSDQRRSTLEAFSRGEFQFCTNVDVLTEGYDNPRVSCVVNARPTKSRAAYVQRCGRGTRLLGKTYAESLANGKRDCLLLDVTGTAGKHRLIGPIDALNGDIPEDVRAEVSRLIGTATRSLMDIEAEASANAGARAEAIAGAAAVRFHSECIDPFIGARDGSGELGGDTDPAWKQFPLSDKQRKALDDLGVTVSKLPAGFSLFDADRLIGRLRARKFSGLATYAQAKKLVEVTKNYCTLDTRQLPRERADAMLATLRAARFAFSAIAGEPEIREARALQREQKRGAA